VCAPQVHYSRCRSVISVPLQFISRHESERVLTRAAMVSSLSFRAAIRLGSIEGSV
jgi:hypothetical protein